MITIDYYYFPSFLPLVSSTDLPSTEIFCEQVRENLARKLNIESTQFDEQEVAELKKRPDLLRRRHGKTLSSKFFSLSLSLSLVLQHNVEMNFNK